MKAPESNNRGNEKRRYSEIGSEYSRKKERKQTSYYLRSLKNFMIDNSKKRDILE